MQPTGGSSHVQAASSHPRASDTQTTAARQQPSSASLFATPNLTLRRGNGLFTTSASSQRSAAGSQRDGGSSLTSGESSPTSGESSPTTSASSHPSSAEKTDVVCELPPSKCEERSDGCELPPRLCDCSWVARRGGPYLQRELSGGPGGASERPNGRYSMPPSLTTPPPGHSCKPQTQNGSSRQKWQSTGTS